MRLTHRLHFIKLSVLLGLLISVLLSSNLWGGDRYFPKASWLSNYHSIIPPFDYAFLVMLVALIIISAFTHSKIPLILLILFSIFLCIDDQNRLQPWFYNYILILFILLFYKERVDEPNNYTSIFITIQLLIALVYIYSGLQKFNTQFIDVSLKYILAPFDHFFTERQFNLIFKLGRGIPYLELLIGLGLLFKPSRYLAVPIVITMHVLILILLGPLGNNYNEVIWPWNITMIVLNVLLFANVKRDTFFDISLLFKYFYFYTVILLMLVLPFFSFTNKYDSYLSSSLYSGNTNGGVLVLTDKAYQKLPYYIKYFTTKAPNYNVLSIKNWAITELNVPCVPEYRIFEVVQQEIITLTHTNKEEVQLVFTEREKIFNF
jgi:hypothetical protein